MTMLLQTSLLPPHMPRAHVAQRAHPKAVCRGVQRGKLCDIAGTKAAGGEHA